jgi:hypothetical protein
MLWLTRDEMRLLAPKVGTPGETITVPGEICARFFGTLGIDYMEGSVNALPVRDSRMTLTVQSARGSETVLRIEGLAEMGVPFESHDRGGENSRGSVLRVAGEAVYDTDKGTFTGFSVAGAGRAWGNKMNYINREIGIGEYPWHYGIAWELVTGDAPMDRIPPYNLLHYGTGEPYFGARGEPAGGH